MGDGPATDGQEEDGGAAVDQPPFVLQPAAPPEPEPPEEPPGRRGRLAGHALVVGILVAFTGLNVGMLAEFVAVQAFVTGERVEIACDGSGRCTLARSGSWGTFRPVGRFPVDGVAAVDPNCGLASAAGDTCRPGLWLVGWDGPVDPGLAPPGRSVPAGAVFVPLADRAHGSWQGDLTMDEVRRARAAGGPWRLRVDTHRWLPFPLVPVLLGAEAVGVAALVAVVGRRIARDQRLRRVTP